MSKTEQSYVLTGREVYILASVKGISNIFGLFTEENLCPPRHEIPYVLSALASKGFITQTEGMLALSEDIDQMMSCYEQADSVLAIYFAEESIPDICTICSEERLLYTESVLFQPNAIKMQWLTPQQLCRQLEEDGYLQDVPSGVPPQTDPDENEINNGLREIATIQNRKGKCEPQEWKILSSYNGCYILHDDGTLAFVCRSDVLRLVQDLLGVPAPQPETAKQKTASGSTPLTDYDLCPGTRKGQGND